MPTDNHNDMIFQELLTASRDIRLSVNDIMEKMVHKEDFQKYQKYIYDRIEEIEEDITENIKPENTKNTNFRKNSNNVLKVIATALVTLAIAGAASIMHLNSFNQGLASSYPPAMMSSSTPHNK